MIPPWMFGQDPDPEAQELKENLIKEHVVRQLANKGTIRQEMVEALFEHDFIPTYVLETFTNRNRASTPWDFKGEGLRFAGKKDTTELEQKEVKAYPEGQETAWNKLAHTSPEGQETAEKIDFETSGQTDPDSIREDGLDPDPDSIEVGQRSEKQENWLEGAFRDLGNISIPFTSNVQVDRELDPNLMRILGSIPGATPVVKEFFKWYDPDAQVSEGATLNYFKRLGANLGPAALDEARNFLGSKIPPTVGALGGWEKTDDGEIREVGVIEGLGRLHSTLRWMAGLKKGQMPFSGVVEAALRELGVRLENPESEESIAVRGMFENVTTVGKALRQGDIQTVLNELEKNPFGLPMEAGAALIPVGGFSKAIKGAAGVTRRAAKRVGAKPGVQRAATGTKALTKDIFTTLAGIVGQPNLALRSFAGGLRRKGLRYSKEQKTLYKDWLKENEALIKRLGGPYPAIAYRIASDLYGPKGAQKVISEKFLNILKKMNIPSWTPHWNEMHHRVRKATLDVDDTGIKYKVNDEGATVLDFNKASLDFRPGAGAIGKTPDQVIQNIKVAEETIGIIDRAFDLFKNGRFVAIGKKTLPEDFTAEDIHKAYDSIRDWTPEKVRGEGLSKAVRDLRRRARETFLEEIEELSPAMGDALKQYASDKQALIDFSNAMPGFEELSSGGLGGKNINQMIKKHLKLSVEKQAKWIKMLTRGNYVGKEALIRGFDLMPGGPKFRSIAERIAVSSLAPRWMVPGGKLTWKVFKRMGVGSMATYGSASVIKSFFGLDTLGLGSVLGTGFIGALAIGSPAVSKTLLLSAGFGKEVADRVALGMRRLQDMLNSVPGQPHGVLDTIPVVKILHEATKTEEEKQMNETRRGGDGVSNTEARMDKPTATRNGSVLDTLGQINRRTNVAT